jgi:hypothetical protein
MAFDTKVALASAADIVATSDNLEEAYERISDLANVEGVVLKPYHEKKKKKE